MKVLVFFGCSSVLVWFGWLVMKVKVEMETKVWPSSMLIYPFSSLSSVSVIFAPKRATQPVPDVGTYYSSTEKPHRNHGQTSVNSQRIPNFSLLSRSPPRPSFLLIPLEPSSLRCAFTWRIGSSFLPTCLHASGCHSLCALDNTPTTKRTLTTLFHNCSLQR
ncbi:MAG: hypothetical protein JOS17DRAFT_191420 [Linnemannia elongata]|nr:MAG: hypothetical protein JOS17DRAFT_191420 [Linnemannia elongata]